MAIRDPFMDHLPVILEQVKRESVGAPAVNELTVDQALKAIICNAYNEPCFICDRRPDLVEAYFVPPELAKFNQAVIFYSLCKECQLDLATHGKVVDKLTGQLKEENARMGGVTKRIRVMINVGPIMENMICFDVEAGKADDIVKALTEEVLKWINDHDPTKKTPNSGERSI